jgi:hypothetical protein
MKMFKIFVLSKSIFSRAVKNVAAEIILPQPSVSISSSF